MDALLLTWRSHKSWSSLIRKTAEGDVKHSEGEKHAVGRRRSLWWCQNRKTQFSKPSFARFQAEAV